MVHAEEGNVVTTCLLELGEVEHVRLGAAAAIQELVDVKDPHG
jgi:hypothetical protein